MGDAWTGEMTDVMQNVWMGWLDYAWTGAMTDINAQRTDRLYGGCMDRCTERHNVPCTDGW